MTRVLLELEFKEEKRLHLLLELLKAMDISVIKRTDGELNSLQQAADFYSKMSTDFSNFKFDRDEANER